MPQLHLRNDRRDMRDMLIAQQVRRIDELEREVDRLRRSCSCSRADGDGDDGSATRGSNAGGMVFGGETGV